MNEKWKQALLNCDSTLHDAISNLNKSGLRIVLVVNRIGVLEGVVCDGDIRRGLLRGLKTESSISNILQRNPIFVTPHSKRDSVKKLMANNSVDQIPIVDCKRRVLGLYTKDEINEVYPNENVMVIMAGGLGKRLRPNTDKCPKSMLLVNGRPMLEHIILHARSEGFRNFIISVNYLGHIIEEHFGNGKNFGVSIEYLREKKPLGTAGALSLLKPKPSQVFLVTNGDVLTSMDYKNLVTFHNQHTAAATMAIRLHEWQHPFGVVNMDDINIVSIEEKPLVHTCINAGVYALSPEVLDLIKPDTELDMTELFQKVRESGSKTIGYMLYEPWLDVGRPDDLIIANSVQAPGHGEA